MTEQAPQGPNPEASKPSPRTSADAVTEYNAEQAAIGSLWSPPDEPFKHVDIQIDAIHARQNEIKPGEKVFTGPVKKGVDDSHPGYSYEK